MKRLFTISLVILMLLGLLAGCGAKSDGYVTAPGAAPEAAPEAAPMEPMEEEVIYDEAASETGGSSTALPENQKLIRTVYMDAETLSMTNLLSWMDARVAALGGYYEQKSVYRRGSRDDGSYYHSGDFIIRIPAENLDQFVAQVGEEANVTSNSESGDVQEQLSIGTEGKDLTIAFNVRYITDVLKALSDDEVRMRFNSNVSPCVVCPTEGDAYLYLVLPVRVFNG